MDEIDALVDLPAIINPSGWNITEPVTIANKAALLQQLIWEEVILRREGNIQAFKRGLNHLKLLQFMQTNADLLKPLFVAKCEEVTAEVFMGLVSSLRPRNSGHLTTSETLCFILKVCMNEPLCTKYSITM